MFKKIIIVFICLTLLTSCGRKNDLFEASLNNYSKIIAIPKKNEIHQ